MDWKKLIGWKDPAIKEENDLAQQRELREVDKRLRVLQMELDVIRRSGTGG